MPARDARGGARRLTLMVRIQDGRHARRFDAIDGVARLRLQFRGARVFAALGRPSRSEEAVSTARAVELLDALRKGLDVTYIGSARDAGSQAFETAFHGAVRRRLTRHLVPTDPGGTTTVYRSVRGALGRIERAVKAEAEDVWRALDDGLPAGMARSARIEFGLSMEALVDWSASRSSLYVSTGDHDERMVPPHELGAGLQSLLLMLLLQRRPTGGPGPLLLLEEPEALLHPSAQRALARALFDAPDLRLVASTHSTVVVDESVAADVVVVRRHRVYSPADVDERRLQINSALLTGQGSEAIFSRSVLLVEGPGDRAYFERIRRRLAEVVPVGVLSNLGIVAVGGKTRFGPWIQLLESYLDRHSGFRPIDYLVVADSADAGADVIRGFRDAGQSVNVGVGRAISAIASAFGEGSIADARHATAEANSRAEEDGFPAVLLPIDLEYAAIEGMDDATLDRLRERLDFEFEDRCVLLDQLGSKHQGEARGSKKGDWIRAELAAETPLTELSPSIRAVLRRWLGPVLRDGGMALPAVLEA